MDAGREMYHDGLSRFGIYKKSSVLYDLRSRRSKGQKLCFVSFIAVLFILSITIALLDYTNANASPNTISSIKFDRIYTNHRHNLSNLENNRYASLPEERENNRSYINTTEDDHTNDVSNGSETKNVERINTEYTVSEPNTDLTEDSKSIDANTTNAKAYPMIRRRFYRYNPNNEINARPTSRKQRILNSPPLYHGSDIFTSDQTFFGPPQLHYPMHYDHAPMSVFTENYAQLGPYRDYNNVKSINNVLHYLDPSQVFLTTLMPDLMQTNKKKMIKFTGTYVRPLADESSEGSEEIPASILPHKNNQARPFIKGQNFTDPFKKLRPFNPLEINRLQPSTGDKFEPRIKKGHSSYLPKPPFQVKPPCPLDPKEVQIPNTSAGTQTVAIFHPPDPGNFESLNEQKQYRKRRKRPISLMLDIYPVQNDAGPAVAPTNTKYATIPQHMWGPYRPPSSGDEFLQQPATNSPLQPDNRMVVHLNLYPTKYGKNPKYRRGRSNKGELMTVLSGGTFNKKISGDNDAIILARNKVQLSQDLQDNFKSLEEQRE